MPLRYKYSLEVLEQNKSLLQSVMHLFSLVFLGAKYLENDF